MDIEEVPIDELEPWSENYRGHPQNQLEHLQESLGEFGWFKNIVIASDNVIIGGNGIYEAARRRGEKTVPAKRMPFPSTDWRAKKLAIVDNEVVNLAKDDERQLTELLKELRDTETGLDGTGYDDEMLANLVFMTRDESEIEDFDAAAEWLGMPDMESEKRETGVKLIVWCRTEEDRAKFMDKNGLENRGGGREQKTISCWWPPKERDERQAQQFEEAASE